ncbi:MAG: cupin domain-containing protein [Actinomycetota bacterium]|nr:cupin domain-containing protein [Actinomycetota bacterium]
MLVRREEQDRFSFEEQYNVWGRRLFPWDGVPEPEWGGAWVAVDPHTTSAPHDHDENELFFILEGRGSMRIDGEVRPVKPGDMVFIPPFHEHALTNEGDTRLLFLTIWWGGGNGDAKADAAAEEAEAVGVAAAEEHVAGR